MCLRRPSRCNRSGQFTVLIMKLPAARIGDMTAHGGSIVMGMPTVLTGNLLRVRRFAGFDRLFFVFFTFLRDRPSSSAAAPA